MHDRIDRTISRTSFCVPLKDVVVAVSPGWRVHGLSLDGVEKTVTPELVAQLVVRLREAFGLRGAAGVCVAVETGPLAS